MDYVEKSEFFISLLEEKNLSDIYAVDITKLTSEANVFIMATASSDRQAKTACDFIEEKAKEENLSLLGKEGEKEGKWILLDYGDVVIHVFQKDERAFYNLERLWSDARIIKSEE